MSQELFNVAADPSGVLPSPINTKNYAKTGAVVRRARDKIISQMKSRIAHRLLKEDSWVRYWDVWNTRQTEDARLYEGQSDLYIGMARKTIETFVSQVTENLFPRTGIFRIQTFDPFFAEHIEHVGRLTEHFVEQAGIEQELESFIRQGLITGISPVKVQWRTLSYPTFRPEGAIPPGQEKIFGSQAQVFAPVQRDLFMFDGPTFQPVDILRWGVWPETAKNLHEARVIWERMDVDFAHLQAMEDAGIYHNVKRVKEGMGKQAPPDDQSTSNRDRRNERHGLTVRQFEKAQEGIFEIVEYWGKMELPHTNKREVPVQIVAFGETVLLIRQNPFWHQMPPYLFWRVIDLVDDFYGQGLIESIEHPQYALNALINLALDNVYWQNAPMMAVNVNRLNRDAGELTIAPQFIVEVDGVPRDIIEWWKPPDTSQSAFFAGNLISGLIQDLVGAPPIIQGRLGGKDITATQARILEGGASALIRAMTRRLEVSVMSPLLRMMHALSQQFMSIRRQQQITLLNGLQIPPEAIVGDYSWRWLTSTQAIQRAQEEQLEQQLYPDQAQGRVPPTPQTQANQPQLPAGAQGISGIGGQLGL